MFPHHPSRYHQLCRPTTTLRFSSLLPSLRGHPRNPSLQPSCLRLQQHPSFQSEIVPQRGGQEPQLLRGGMQTNGLCHARGCCSELISHPPPPPRACPASPHPPARQATSSTPAPPGVNQVWPLPAASPSPEKELAACLTASRSLGTRPEPNLLGELAPSSVRAAAVIY